jgi:hypothetical protein
MLCSFETVIAAEVYRFFSAVGFGLPPTTFNSISKSDHIGKHELSDRKHQDDALEWKEVRHFFSQEYTNILDKMYGLQGLLSSDHRFAVDYSISTGELIFRQWIVLTEGVLEERPLLGEQEQSSLNYLWYEFVLLLEYFGGVLQLWFSLSVV